MDLGLPIYELEIELLRIEPRIWRRVLVPGTPPEDCGGVGGYQTFLEAIRNKKHERHKELLTWIGGSFDSEFFDLEAVNSALRKSDLRPRW